MNTCSIHDLLRLALPPGTRLLTPETGLRQPIRHAVSLRATLPAFPALHGGELVLMSVQDALALDERLTLRNIIARLSNVRIAAIAAVGPIDDEAVAAAVAADLPLLHLPAPANPRAVERDVLLLLDNPRLQVERRAAQLYSDLTQQVARGEGIAGVLHTVAEATGRSVGFYDTTSRLCAHQGPASTLAIFEALRPKSPGKVAKNPHPMIVEAVAKGTTRLGYVALYGSALDQWDEMAADRAAAALALELTKEQAVQAVEARVSGDLLRSLVNGAPPNIVVLQEQASALGYDLRRPHVALLIAPADGITVGMVRDRMEREIQIQQRRAPHIARDHAVLCLYPTDDRLEQPWSLLRTLASELPIGAGMSTPAPTAAAWQRAYTEAEQALALGRHLFGPCSLTSFADLHVYRLLFELRASPELWNFHQTILGALVEYDRRHHAALLETLEGYFAAQGNLSQAARQLQIHRNTLLYRLRRISQIGGVDLERPEDALALQLALKAHRVLASLDSRQ